MNKFMEYARILADENIYTNTDCLFGRGSNHVFVINDPIVYVKIMAIRDACKSINSYDLFDCEMYTTSYPCPMCMSAIIWANIKKVYYGNMKEDTAKIGFRDDFIYDFLDKLLR